MTLTEAEANDILNAFAGWTPGQKCSAFQYPAQLDGVKVCVACAARTNHFGTHDIPPTNYFADTPEAREAVDAIEKTIVERDRWDTESDACYQSGKVEYSYRVIGHKRIYSGNKYHAIAFALAAALKERR